MRTFTIAQIAPDLAIGQKTVIPTQVSVQFSPVNYGLSLATGEQLPTVQLFAYDVAGSGAVAMTKPKILSLSRPTTLSFKFNVYTTHYMLSGSTGTNGLVFASVITNPYNATAVSLTVPLTIKLKFMISHDSLNTF